MCEVQRQADIFDFMYEDFKFREPIKALTLFSGIGFQEMGMDLGKIPYEMVGTRPKTSSTICLVVKQLCKRRW